MNATTRNNKPWVGLSYLRIESVHPDTGNPIDEVIIKAYANGRQQIPIRLIFEAIDEDGVVTDNFPDSDLSLFKLIDYNTGNQLSYDWGYSSYRDSMFDYFDGKTRDPNDALNKKAEQLLGMLHLPKDLTQDIRDNEEKWADFKEKIARGDIMLPHLKGDSGDSSQLAHVGARARKYRDLWITTTASQLTRIAAQITCPNGNKATIRSNARVHNNPVEVGGKVIANYSESSFYASPQQPKPPAEYRFAISEMVAIYEDWNDGVCWFNRYVSLSYLDRQIDIVLFLPSYEDQLSDLTITSDLFRRDHKIGIMSIHAGSIYTYIKTFAPTTLSYRLRGAPYSHSVDSVAFMYGGQQRKDGQLTVSMTWLWANWSGAGVATINSQYGYVIDKNGNEHRVRFSIPRSENYNLPHEFYVERA